ncbi:MAG: hypothetical protein AAGI90_04130, partial [Chlamydiota bacterium]
MEELFARDSFAYTLLGSKPVSWVCYHSPVGFMESLYSFFFFKDRCTTIYLGWKAWEKHRHLFPKSLFISEFQPRHPGEKSILLINQEMFNKVIQDHRKDFEEVLQREVVGGDQLLEETTTQNLMGDLLQSHQALLGIVLGYGRDNSWKFLEKSAQREPLGWVWTEEEYWKEGEQTWQYSSSTERSLTLYSCPSFAGIPDSSESIALKQDYTKTREKVLKYYRGKDFLEATLSLLAGFRPEE